jgi:hypothetical protein
MHLRQEEERMLAQSRCGMQRSIPAALLDSDECDCARLRSRTVAATEENVSDARARPTWQGPPRARSPVWAVEQGLCEAHVVRSHGAPSPQQRGRRGKCRHRQVCADPLCPPRNWWCHVDECRCAASFSGTCSGWCQERGCCQVRSVPRNLILVT